MKKLFIFLTMLVVGIVSSWATLSSNTIAKSGNVTDTWNITSALPTDNWTAMGDNTPAGVTALGSYTAYCRKQDITLSDEGALFITFLFSTGSHQLEILGVDLLDSDDKVVRSDYHYGKTGTLLSNNIYIIDHIESGNYKIRFIINDGVSNSVGNITVKHANIKTASSFANITQWYFIRIHSNQNNYMYYNSGATPNIGFEGSGQNNAHYLWGFVKDTDGIRIYNKAAGSSVAIDNATPCTLSASGQTFTLGTGSAGNNGAAAGAYFSLYKNPERSATSRSYLNYQSAIKRWGSDDEGSAFMIDEQTFDAPFVEASEGKIYKIKAYFNDYDDLYFTNNDGTLVFNTSATNDVKDYWILRSSGSGQYPWKFESGRGDGKFLSGKNGLSNTGVYLQINTYNTLFDLRGSKDGDAYTSGIVNLGTWNGVDKTGFGAYGDGGCWGSTGHNTSGTWTTEYTIEEVTGVSIYTVVSNINAGGVTKTVYTGKAEQTNGGFYILSSTPSASDFTAISVDGYTAGDIVVDVSAKTITVNYTANITYTLTDVNGAEYTWSASGTFGTSPTITGCYGLTVSNEEWNEKDRTYTADIAFPFPISSNSVTNWTYIGSFHNNNNYSSENFLWQAKDGSPVRVYSGEVPNNTKSGVVYTENERYKWAIYTTCSSGNFTFKIKNSSTGQYINSPSTTNNAPVAFVDEASASLFTYVAAGSTKTCNNICAWKADNNMYLSVNSVNSGSSTTNQKLLVYNGVHDGISVGYYTPADFATLETNLINVCLAYTSFKTTHTIGSGLGEYSGDTYVTMETALAKAKSASPVYTAAELTTDIAILENSETKLTINQPTAGFYRFHIGDKYMCSDANNSNVRTTTETNNDASTIFYLDENNYLIAYSDGYGFNFGYCRATTPGIFNGFDFSESATIGYYNIHSNAGTGDATWSDRNITIDTDDNILTEGQGTWTIEPVESLPLTLAANSYTSFSAPVAIIIPGNCKAYIAKTKNNNTIKMEEVTGNIPANTGIIIGTEADANPTFTVYNGSDFANCDGNILASNVAASALYRNDNYFFGKQKSTGNYIFTKLSGTEENYILYGHKAYLPQANIPGSGSEARIAVIWDDDPTGLNELKDDSMEVKDGKYYQNQKIVVIRNGVKYNVAGQIIK